MNKKNNSITVGMIAAVFLIAVLYFWPKGLVTADSGQCLVMGTFARVVSVAADSSIAGKCIDAAFEQINTVESLMSIHRDDSEISRVNGDGFNRAVKVSKPTYEVLQKAIEFSRRTEGAFDITIGPLAELWQSAAEANSVPTQAEIQQVSKRVGFRKITLDDDQMSVRFAVEGMKLDLGGIAKGYAIDRTIDAMRKCGAVGAMVDIGGDIKCFGSPPKGRKKWLIGLQDPAKVKDDIAPDQLLLRLKLTNQAIATSGDYRRFVLIKGNKYSHIIDVKKGSSSNQLSSVTIIADSAIDADALATAVSVMGTEKGLALIESMPQTEAILIPASAGMTSQPQYKLIKSSGAGEYIE